MSLSTITISTTWTAGQFLSAAERHYETCKQLKNFIAMAGNDSKSKLLTNLFYLSGYVIECSLKYAICSAADSGGSEISRDKQALNGLNIFHHRLDDLMTKAQSISSFRGSSYNLLNTWSEQIRYEFDLLNDGVSEAGIIAFYETAIEIINLVRSR